MPMRLDRHALQLFGLVVNAEVIVAWDTGTAEANMITDVGNRLGGDGKSSLMLALPLQHRQPNGALVVASGRVRKAAGAGSARGAKKKTGKEKETEIEAASGQKRGE